MSKDNQKTAEVQDHDFSLVRVPKEHKQEFWRILLIRIGAICCVSQLMLGASLGMGMTFTDALIATLLGSVLLQVLSWAIGAAAAKEGLSTSLISRWAGFGVKGSAIFGAVVAISMIGWFGVQNSVFGQGMADIIPVTDFLGSSEIAIWTVVTGLGITVLVVFGIRAIAHLATIFVPLFILAVIYAAYVMLQTNDLGTLMNTAPPGAALTMGAAVTIVAGGFIAGAICTPDYARFLSNSKQVFWMTLIGTFIGELGMNMTAVLLAHATGTENVVDLMMATSGFIGVLIVVASTVKLNDINLYASGLGLMNAANALSGKKLNRNILIVCLGAVGTTLSVIGIINYFTDFLILLGVAIPPVAGIMVIDYYILKRSRKDLDESRALGKLPAKVEVWNPVAIVSWIVGFAVGQTTVIINLGIPGLNSLIVAGLLYFAIMKILAKIKNVEVVEFKKVDSTI